MCTSIQPHRTTSEPKNYGVSFVALYLFIATFFVFAGTWIVPISQLFIFSIFILHFDNCAKHCARLSHNVLQWSFVELLPRQRSSLKVRLSSYTKQADAYSVTFIYSLIYKFCKRNKFIYEWIIWRYDWWWIRLLGCHIHCYAPRYNLLNHFWIGFISKDHRVIVISLCCRHSKCSTINQVILKLGFFSLSMCLTCLNHIFRHFVSASDGRLDAAEVVIVSLLILSRLSWAESSHWHLVVRCCCWLLAFSVQHSYA